MCNQVDLYYVNEICKYHYKIISFAISSGLSLDQSTTLVTWACEYVVTGACKGT
jgi:hypothetical protein